MRIKFRVPGLDAAPRYIWVNGAPHELRVRASFARSDVLLHFHYVAPDGTTIDHDADLANLVNRMNERNR